MTTKFNVGDTVLIKGIVETIYVETTDNEPVYLIRIKGAGEYEGYCVRVKENVMEVSTDMRNKKKETTFDDYLKEQLKDPEFRKERERLRDEDMQEGEEEQ